LCQKEKIKGHRPKPWETLIFKVLVEDKKKRVRTSGQVSWESQELPRRAFSERMNDELCPMSLRDQRQKSVYRTWQSGR
jgi:hypothetical protein